MRIQEKTSNSKFSFYNFVSRQLDRLDSGYERLIRWVLHHKTFVICFMTAIFLGSCSLTRFIKMFALCLGSCSLMKYIKTDFMPQNDQSNMTVYAKMQSGQRVEETKRVALQIDSMIRADIPEITIINLSYGSEEEASFASMMNSTGNNILNMRLRTVDIKDRERSIFVIADQVRSILKSFPDVLQYTVSTSSSGGSMGSNSVDIEIMGHDFNTTTRLAQDIAVKARQIPGAEDIKISRDDDKAELQIALDQDKLARHGLTTSEVGSYVRNRIYGFRNSKFKEDGEEYDIIVRLDEKYRSSLTEIENILIIDGHGEKIRLKELGEIKEYFSPPNIERKSKQRILKVLEEARNVYENRTTKIPTARLNEEMLPLIEAYPPPSNKGKYIKIKYITQLPNTQVPSFVYFANLPQYVKEPYKRFLENKMREKWNLTGTPINIYIRQK